MRPAPQWAGRPARGAVRRSDLGPLADLGPGGIAAKHGHQHARRAVQRFAQRQPREREQHRQEKLRALPSGIPGGGHHADAGKRSEGGAERVEPGLQAAKRKHLAIRAGERGKRFATLMAPGTLGLERNG